MRTWTYVLLLYLFIRYTYVWWQNWHSFCPIAWHYTLGNSYNSPVKNCAFRAIERTTNKNEYRNSSTSKRGRLGNSYVRKALGNTFWFHPNFPNFFFRHLEDRRIRYKKYSYRLCPLRLRTTNYYTINAWHTVQLVSRTIVKWNSFYPPYRWSIRELGELVTKNSLSFFL